MSEYINHNLQVFIRVKPEGQGIAIDGNDSNFLSFADRNYHFHNIIAPTVSQNEVFKLIGQRLINNALEGQNGCVLAFGQKESGKTYTLIGENDGLLPQSLLYLFDSPSQNLSIKLSYYEINNDNIYDLLSSKENQEFIIAEEIANYDGAIALINKGKDIAKTRTTYHRSHTLFILQYSASNQEGEFQIHKNSKIYFIELAVPQLDEQIKNSSFQNLELLFKAFTQKIQSNDHIPFEYQKLLSQLHDLLVSNPKIFLIATVDSLQIKETHQILQLAEKIEQIQGIIGEQLTPNKLQKIQEEINDKNSNHQNDQDWMMQFQKDFDRITALFKHIQETPFEFQLKQGEKQQEELSEKKQFINQVKNYIEQCEQLNAQKNDIENQYLILYEENESQKQIIRELQRKISQMHSQQQFQYSSGKLQQELQEHKFQLQFEQFRIKQLEEQNINLKRENKELKEQRNYRRQFQQIRQQQRSLENRYNELQSQLHQILNEVPIPPQYQNYQNIIDNNVIAQLKQLEDTFFNMKGCRQVELNTNIFGELIQRLNNLNTNDQRQVQEFNEMRAKLTQKVQQSNNLLQEKEQQIQRLKAQLENKIILKDNKIRIIKGKLRQSKKSSTQKQQDLNKINNELLYIERKLVDYVDRAFNNTSRIISMRQQELYDKATQKDQSKLVIIESLIDFLFVIISLNIQLDKPVYQFRNL